MMREETKNPILDKPLRNPGQSLDEEIDELIDNEGSQYVILPAFAVILAALEWFRWAFSVPYSPIIFSLLAVFAIAFSAYKIVKIRKRLKILRQGRDGEKAVGQYLEFLREDGCKVLHDIVGNDFNVDHVIISPNGIFTVETKTYSKPVKGKAVIQHRGNDLFINGTIINSAIAVQAKAEAHWLRSLLKDISGKEYPVKPVVVFPGWFIESDKASKDLWVLNPKALRSYVSNSQPVLSHEEVQFLANGLSRHIRNTPK